MKKYVNENLYAQRCFACSIDTPTLPKDTVEEYMKEIEHGWKLSADGKSIMHEFRFKDFKEALAFANRIGDIAEDEGHHPDMTISWGRVLVELKTHKIDGLSKNDFILAAKIDKIDEVSH